ncbi:MAG: hypothetical protein EOO81_05685 [Oxalobacteraceae bacterium]|nr:MAG: hypothetical protein EOO81_05685 [Oxalobacteraceae bacterium]
MVGPNVPFVAVPDAGDSALLNAVEWCQAVLLGSVGSSLAIMGIAGLGFALLQGRLPYRAGARMILGVFILFGAPVISLGLLGIFDLAGSNSQNGETTQRSTAPPLPLPSTPAGNPDPYAGAAMPTQP